MQQFQSKFLVARTWLLLRRRRSGGRRQRLFASTQPGPEHLPTARRSRRGQVEAGSRHCARRNLLLRSACAPWRPPIPTTKPRYDGDLRARDAAYHQGTVWAWLIGPFFDAWLRAHPGDWETARALLAGFDIEMSLAGIGTISEIFDAEPPFNPRGCIAQAWSVAEVLRCELKLRAAKPAILR